MARFLAGLVNARFAWANDFCEKGKTMKTMNCKTNGLLGKMGVVAMVAMVAAVVVMGGCTSNVHRPEMAQATKNKDGVFFVDLRRSVASAGEAEREKSITQELVEKNCKLPENNNNAVCVNPKGFILYSAQVRNAIWGKGPVFVGVYIPNSLKVTAFAPPSEKDGDIVRAKVIPGPVSMLAYDGIIERHDDPNRACWWDGSHNYSGGVVCPKYGYDHRDLDISKF